MLAPTQPAQPRLDFRVTDAAFVVETDLPGLARKDIVVEAHEDRITVHGEVMWNAAQALREDAPSREPYDAFYRSFTLPRNARLGDIEAVFSKGVLTVSIPRTTALSPRRIEVKAADESA